MIRLSLFAFALVLVSCIANAQTVINFDDLPFCDETTTTSTTTQPPTELNNVQMTGVFQLTGTAGRQTAAIDAFKSTVKLIYKF